jgi:hypothetical protein
MLTEPEEARDLLVHRFVAHREDRALAELLLDRRDSRLDRLALRVAAALLLNFCLRHELLLAVVCSSIG